MRIGVPAYFDPDVDATSWRRLCEAAPVVGLVVANAYNGPGTSRNPSYVSVIEQARRVGITVLGYVHASYGARDPTDVCADVERWHAWYALDGVFVDEIGSSAEHAAYNTTLANAIRALQPLHRGSQLAFNPGMSTDAHIPTLCDVVLSWEGTWPNYREKPPRPSQSNNTAADNRVWHVVHDCATRTQLRAAVRLAAARGAGWLYVTPGREPNPYGHLPPAGYWLEEVDAVARMA